MSSQDLGPAGHDPYFGAGVVDVARLIDMELPDLSLVIDSPPPGTLHDPASGALLLKGRAEGRDLASVEIEVAQGLSTRGFEPIEAFGNSMTKFDAVASLDPGVLARWDTSNVPDGPYVIRVRARLVGGEVVDEHAVVGIERNTPIRLSQGDRAVARPNLSARQIVWQFKEAEAQENGVVNHDLAIGYFPEQRVRQRSFQRVPMALVEREGDQLNPISFGREVAWAAPEGPVTMFERCRLERGSRHCDPIPVSTQPGRYTNLQIGRDWLVWMRFDEGVNRLEGCRIGPKAAACTPRPLIASGDAEGWILKSYDGETLFLRRGLSEHARCRLTQDAGLCEPEIVSFSADSPNPTDLVHDGSLVAFKALGIENRPPSGCSEVLAEVGCATRFVAVVRLHACWLSEGDPECDPIAIGPAVPIESFQGMDVSDRRVTWAVAEGVDRSAIHFCEFISETQECAVQRVSGTLSPQRFPSIDSNRLVWEDGRLGPVVIFGLELPNIDAPRTVEARAGQTFRAMIRGFAGAGEELRFEVEGIDGFTPDDANASLVRIGSDEGFAILSGRIPRGTMGSAHWKLRAVGEGGLFSDHVMEISVQSIK